MREHKEKKLPKPKPKILPSLGGLKNIILENLLVLKKVYYF